MTASYRSTRDLLFGLATAGALVLAIALQSGRDRVAPLEALSTRPLLYITSPELMSRMALEFDALAADVYWIRAIQHYGGQRLAPQGTSRQYDLLYPLLNMTTSLDPYFGIAYRFGAVFLSEPYPGGPGRPDLAIALLEKGISAQPDRWHYYHDIGFVHYWWLRDLRGAAAWFRQAAARPGSPEWLLPVAAAMLTETSERVAARQLWTQIAHSEEGWLRRRAERGLQQVETLDQIDRLSRVVAASHREGEPYSWSAVVRSGALAATPLDPTGIPYDLDPLTGRISVARNSPLFPMPGDPK